MPQPRSWVSEVIDVLLELGGGGYLNDIYKEISNRKRMDLTSPSWHNTVRNTIFSHSSDTKYFHTLNRTDDQDIFYAPKGLGMGYWAIRESYTKEDGLGNTHIQNYWIEKVLVKGHPEKESGQYAFGRALWSPQRGKGGADIYRFMRSVQPGDVILHFTDNTAITAISQVKTSYEEFTESTLAKYPVYIVWLHNFRRLNPPLTRETIFATPYRERLAALISSGAKNLFYNRELNLNQGAYLTPAPLELVAILNGAYEERTGKTIVNIPNTAPSSQLLLVREREEQKESDHVPTPRLSELELLQHVKNYIAASGYYFDDETVYNYHICLKTRPFVILAGLSGTGKSKLAQLYAGALGYSNKNEHYLRLAVRPSWNDDRYLLGYLNTITGEYVTERAVEFLIQAGNDKGSLYFFCLDEMNLAHVEYYFSQFLSAMEEDDPDDPEIILFSARAQANLTNLDKAQKLPRSILIPTNLLFTGTVNVDETTQPLSDKVMDRANTIEFFAVDLDRIPEPEALPAPPLWVSAADWHSYQTWQPDKTYRSHIISIAKILREGDMGLGYRVVHDIELYLANSKDLLSSESAFDLQVKQRILPHLRGTKIIENVLNKLLDYLSNLNLMHSVQRLQEMKTRLERDGYVNFWR